MFAGREGLEVASAGTSADAEELVTAELVEWADLVVAMEVRHKHALTRAHRRSLRGKRLVVLDIPDRYDFMDPELVALLEARVTPHLRRA